MRTGPKQHDYCTVHLPYIQDHDYMGLCESQKINASTGSPGHEIILCPLKFCTEQCKVWASSLIPVLLPNPHQCRWTEGCRQPWADCSQIITTQLAFSTHTHATLSPPLDFRCVLSHPLYSLPSAAIFLLSSSSCNVVNAWKKTREKAFPPFSLPGNSQISNWIIDPEPHKAA